MSVKLKRFFLISFIFALIMAACAGNVEVSGRYPSADGGDAQLGENVVFSEDFSRCTLSEGPAIQSDNFKADCENPLSHVSFKSNVWKTVGTSHVCKTDYIKTRGFGDWVYLFRCSERKGYMSCGVNDEGKRGIIQSPMMKRIAGISDVEVSFDLMADDAMTDDVSFKVCLAGVIESATLGGRPYSLTHAYDGIEHQLLISRSDLARGWNRITVRVRNATDGTMLYWAGASSDKTMNHGFYLDNILVTRLSDMQRADRNLRVLFWNIQNGMWSDQDKDFANFRAFIQKYDPDVCVWCEAQTIYKNRSTSACSAADRYFPAGWDEFARSYGHKHTAIGGYRLYADDYYPQVVTSKYPVRTLLKITETDSAHQAMADSWEGDGRSHAAEYHAACGPDYCPVAHGAAIQQVDVNGTLINLVTLHLWPHAYSYYSKFVTKEAGNAADAAQSRGGNAQREAEIRYICSRSVEDPAYAGQQLWLMMGDFNTRSRLDNWRYGLPEDSFFLSSHDYILDHTEYRDVIAQTWPGQYFATRTWADDAAGNYPVRYDFMYASPAMMSKVKNALILNEKWTNMVWAMSNYYDSSDHRPILVDFDLTK